MSGSPVIFYRGHGMSSVQSVEQATQLALDFLRKYYSFAFPIVDLDISYFKPSYIRVRIEQVTGTILDYKVTLGQLL